MWNAVTPPRKRSRAQSYDEIEHTPPARKMILRDNTPVTTASTPQQDRDAEFTDAPRAIRGLKYLTRLVNENIRSIGPASYKDVA